MCKRRAWTYDELAEYSLLYSARNEWCVKHQASYQAARKRDLLDELCSHMKPKLKCWNKKSVLKEALKYTTVTDFSKKSSGAYHAANRLGIYQEAISHIKKPFVWNNDDLYKEALKYDTHKDFYTNSLGAYTTASKRGILGDITTHIKKLRKNWTYKDLHNEALKYKTKMEFYTKSKNAYAVAVNRNILDDITSHLFSDCQGDNDIIYLWKVVGIDYLYKIGVTSEKAGTKRIKEIASANNFEYNIIRFVKVNNAKKIEKILLKYGTKTDIHGKGKTEFRYLTNKELFYIKNIINSFSALATPFQDGK